MKCRIALVVLLGLMIAACSNPLPEGRQHYAGEWRAENMYLRIQPDGRVAYERVNGSSSSSVNAPIQEFIGDDFVVGVAFASTRFKVSEAPHLQDGQWQMVVDGVRLTRFAGKRI